MEQRKWQISHCPHLVESCVNYPKHLKITTYLFVVHRSWWSKVQCALSHFLLSNSKFTCFLKTLVKSSNFQKNATLFFPSSLLLYTPPLSHLLSSNADPHSLPTRVPSLRAAYMYMCICIYVWAGVWRKLWGY